MSLIVVEGVDASGKSTLLEDARLRISKRYFLLVRHSCRPLVLNDALRFQRMVENFPGDIIVDRHPLISEFIYGPILRGSTVYGAMTEEEADNHLVKTVNRIIYCRPPTFVIEEKLDNNPQLAGIRENLSALIQAYDQRMDRLSQRLRVVRYDYGGYPQLPFLDELFFGATV